MRPTRLALRPGRAKQRRSATAQHARGASDSRVTPGIRGADARPAGGSPAGGGAPVPRRHAPCGAIGVRQPARRVDVRLAPAAAAEAGPERRGERLGRYWPVQFSAGVTLRRAALRTAFPMARLGALCPPAAEMPALSRAVRAPVRSPARTAGCRAADGPPGACRAATNDGRRHVTDVPPARRAANPAARRRPRTGDLHRWPGLCSAGRRCARPPPRPRASRPGVVLRPLI